MTARNLADTGYARVAFGPTRGVVMLDVDVERVLPTAEAPADVFEAFAEGTDWDPREADGYAFVVLRPQRIQAWREANEIAGRTLMRNGSWLA